MTQDALKRITDDIQSINSTFVRWRLFVIVLTLTHTHTRPPVRPIEDCISQFSKCFEITVRMCPYALDCRKNTTKFRLILVASLLFRFVSFRLIVNTHNGREHTSDYVNRRIDNIRVRVRAYSKYLSETNQIKTKTEMGKRESPSIDSIDVNSEPLNDLERGNHGTTSELRRIATHL